MVRNIKRCARLTRNNAYAFAHNADLGYTVGKWIQRPGNRNALLWPG